MEYASVIVLIIIALLFDFSNGMHDSANSIATIVTTRVMQPKYAIIMAGMANFIAFFLFSHEVAKTVGSGLISLAHITLPVIGATLIAAICWNLLTWKFGLPSSSSHALFGGLFGAGVAHAGSFDVVIWHGWAKILGFMIFAPLLGVVLSLGVMWLLYRIYARMQYSHAQDYAKKMQIFSALCYSIGHGGNDAQKTMGIIATILVAGGITQEFSIPIWVALACYSAIGAGTLCGGMKIIKTLGNKITKLHPVEGSAASLAGSIALFGSSALGVPVSTTHVITGAVSGVGLAKSFHRVRWSFAGSIVVGWFLTIPCAAILGASIYGIYAIFV